MVAHTNFIYAAVTSAVLVGIVGYVAWTQRETKANVVPVDTDDQRDDGEEKEE